MKRTTSIIMALCFALTATMPVMAEDRSSEILSQIKTRIPNTEEYDNFDCRQHEDEMGARYYYEWYSENGNRRMEAATNDKGIITSFSIYNYQMNSDNKIILERASYDEVYEKAKELNKKLNPDIADTVMVEKSGTSEGLYDDYFSFNLQRYENGIPVYADTGYIHISLDCTTIKRYYLNYTEGLSFEDTSELIDKETAKAAFNEKIGMEPEYVIERDYKEKTIKTKLIYKYNTFDKLISAKTGEIIEPQQNSYYGYENSKSMATMEAVSDSGGSGFSVAETKQFEKMENLKTKEQLLDLIKNTKYIDYNPSFKLASYNTYHDELEGKFTADFSFDLRSKEGEYKFLNATLDMKTGEVLSFYQNGIENKKMSEQGVKTAEEAAKALAGDKFEEYKLQEQTENSVIYKRYVNGIACPGNTIHVMIDGNNKVKSYSISYTDIEFISADGILTKEAALEKLYEYDEYKLCYVADKDKFIAVYRFKDYCRFDAFTGEQDNVDEQGIIEYKDIKEHWAENKINTLARFGIGFADGEFKPDEQITQKEFAALLNSIYGNNISIYPKIDWDNIYSLIERRNVIKEEAISPDEPVTRETAAIFLVRCMSAEKYAQIEDIYNCPFEDVVTSKGYITLLYGLGMISGTSENTFSPNEILTRAEAAVMIYNYLTKQ